MLTAFCSRTVAAMSAVLRIVNLKGGSFGYSNGFLRDSNSCFFGRDGSRSLYLYVGICLGVEQRMRITKKDWGVILGELDNYPAEDVERLSEFAAAHRAISMGAVRMPDGEVMNSSLWRTVDRIGLSTRLVRVLNPFDRRERPQVPFGPLLFIPQRIWDHLGGWPEMPNGNGYGEVALGIKAYYSGVRILCYPDMVFEAQDHCWDILNAHFVLAAYFSPVVYENVWRPMLLKAGYIPEIDQVLVSDELKQEQAWLEEKRTVAEELFFRKALWRNHEEMLDVDEEAGIAIPRNQAAYVGYEARRSPGREWYRDKKRQERDVNSLVSFLGATSPRVKWSLLDIGSRDGYVLTKLVEKGFSPENLHGLEISPWSAAWAKENGRPVEQGDAHDLSRFDDESFDIVTSYHNLEHCHTPSTVLKEIHRVLKPGGILALVVPLEQKGGISIKGDHCHTMVSPEAVLDLLGGGGFECMKHFRASKDFVGFFSKDDRG